MQTYITRAEHEAACDYSGPVKIRNHYYRIAVPPVFEDLRDTAQVVAELLPDPTVEDSSRQHVCLRADKFLIYLGT